MAPYEFKLIEPDVLKFWQDSQIYEKLVKRNSGKKKFYYLDGPPYTTGKIHIGHAWGKALRDSILRYKRMNNFDVWDRPGFDMHGLPIEVSVEKLLGIKDKKEIINKFGVQKFIEACEKYSLDNLWPMIEDFKRIGVWLNWKDPYMTIKNEYIEGAWWALAKANDKKLLYLGKKAMTWCPRCATALAKHELEYANRKDESIFVKLPIQNKKNEFLIVWTTTPWTLPYNMAVMANPSATYVRAKVGDEVWVLAEALVQQVIKKAKKEFTVSGTLTGKELAGTRYIHPYKDEVKFHSECKDKNAYSVILSERYVALDAGSGLVHCAPGCGTEDFEVGKEYGITPFNEADDHGCFSDKMGKLAGLIAKQDDDKFVQIIEDKGLLVAKSKMDHEYAHCWRCNTAVIFRATDQWFLAVETLKDKMIQENKKVSWTPEWAGSKHFDSWLTSLRDWCISRQRFWGIPLPIWTCACGKHKVIGTRAELTKLSGKTLDNLHRPWIDQVTLKCECGKEMHRVPDVLDVWLDSGVAPWATLNFPSEEKNFKRLGFPDLILEGSDQIRGWFNSLTCMAMISFGEIPFKSVYMHGMINDTTGRKMSKSLKNFITPYEIIEVYGADTLRYYQIGGAQPGLDLNFNHDDAKTKHKNLAVLWNVHNFIIDLAKELKTVPSKFDATVMKGMFSIEERFMFSKLNSTIKTVTSLFDSYRISEVPAVIEELFLTLSRSYIQMVRDKAAVGEDNDRKVVLYTAYTCLVECLKMLATIAPFISEQMWQDLRSEFKLAEESIHLCEWPKANQKDINVTLEKQMAIADNIVQAILAAREKAKISVRWPIKVVQVVSMDDAVQKTLEELEDVIKAQTNCREVHGHKEFIEVKTTLKPNPGPIGKSFGAKSPKIMAKLALTSSKDALSKLAKDGKFSVQIDKDTVELTKDHIILEREVPKKFIECEFRLGMIYLDTERNDDLEAEGFAREIMRRVQQMRKDAGFKRSDRISLYLQVSKDMVSMLKPHIDKMAEKCGADVCKADVLDPARKHAHSAEEQIKTEKMKFFMDKL